MASYGLLWWLWQRALRTPSVFPAMLITLLYAASDEFHQTFVEGRHGSPLDVLIDAAGIAIAVAIHTRHRTRVRE
jgi:VanZ family protein